MATVRISELLLYKYRNLKKKKLSFLGPDGEPLSLVVLAGPNGCGKTSVLEAILLGLGRITAPPKVQVHITGVDPAATEVEYIPSNRSSTDVGGLITLAASGQSLVPLNAFWKRFRDNGTSFAQTEQGMYLCQGDQPLCPIGELSSGELAVLSLITPFLTRVSPFKGILLFDEPELHMHPEWQMRIVPALRALLPNAQIILATHSALIREQAYSFEQYLLIGADDPRYSNEFQTFEPIGE